MAEASASVCKRPKASASVCSVACYFASQAQCFGRLCVLVAVPLGFSFQAGEGLIDRLVRT